MKSFPRIIPKKVANVFKEIEKWDKRNEALKETVCEYYKKSNDLRKNIQDWEKCADSDYDESGLVSP